MSSAPRPTVPRAGAVTIPARPENLPINPRETALIVVDMQNAYASPGGYLDLAGFDIEGAAAVIEKIALTVEAARRAGVQVVYVGSSRVDLQACKLEYSIVSPK